MKHISFSFLLVLSFLSNVDGQIFCPADITASCFSSLSIQECGNATVVSGNYNTNQIKYIDDKQTNACNEGQVFRRFYLDVDYNNAYTQNEPSCIQTITLEYDALSLNIQFPGELVLDCIDDIPETSPSWSAHPCDLVGYSFDDEYFEFEAGACMKVIRTFSVINWCEYEGTSGNGLYTGTQVIKIVDEVAPEIQNCEDLTFDAVENCEATVTLSNTATDIGNCPSGTLQWTLSVDLWADGTEDLFYGPNEPQPFRLGKTGNGEELSITLPESIGISNHKMVWKVTDGCGNVRSCSGEFEVVDNKPPTPYCKNYLSASLNGEDGGQLVIPAGLFDHGAIDNCSSQEEIRISFSENVDDTERTIECGEIGFQFYRIYYTDVAGNQDFCEVYMFVLDNGSCAGKFEPEGRVETRSGEPIVDAFSYLMDDMGMIGEATTQEDGRFSFGEQSMMETYYTKISKIADPMDGVDVLDYQLMLDAALGLGNLDYYQRVAADLNEDGIVNISDLEEFRDVLTGKIEMDPAESWKFVPHSQVPNSDAVFDSKMSILNYEQGFNFWAVKKGDLTGAKSSDINTVSEEVDLLLEIYNDKVVITNSNKLATGFYSLELKAESNKIQSDERSEKFENIDGTKIINLTENDLSYATNQFTVSVNRKSTESTDDIMNKLIGEVKFLNASHNGISQVNWDIVDLRTDSQQLELEEELALTVYPTVFTDNINIEGGNINSVMLRKFNGQTVATTLDRSTEITRVVINENLPKGMYFLSVMTDSGEQIFKVVR